MSVYLKDTLGYYKKCISTYDELAKDANLHIEDANDILDSVRSRIDPTKGSSVEESVFSDGWSTVRYSTTTYELFIDDPESGKPTLYIYEPKIDYTVLFRDNQFMVVCDDSGEGDVWTARTMVLDMGYDKMSTHDKFIIMYSFLYTLLSDVGADMTDMLEEHMKAFIVAIIATL